jgi:hypothetical protein
VRDASVGELTWLARDVGEVAEQYRDDQQR